MVSRWTPIIDGKRNPDAFVSPSWLQVNQVRDFVLEFVGFPLGPGVWEDEYREMLKNPLALEGVFPVQENFYAKILKERCWRAYHHSIWVEPPNNLLRVEPGEQIDRLAETKTYLNANLSQIQVSIDQALLHSMYNFIIDFISWQMKTSSQL